MTKDRHWRMLTAALVVAALAYGGCAGRAAVDHGGSLVSEEGQIAFTLLTEQTGMDIAADIYTINVDGSNERRLTDTPGLDGMPAWSPDGERMAFVSDRAGGTWEIYLMDADGTQQHRLTNTPEEDEAVPAWSPDGEKMAYVTGLFGDNPSIWVMDADGTDPRVPLLGCSANGLRDGRRVSIIGPTDEPRVLTRTPQASPSSSPPSPRRPGSALVEFERRASPGRHLCVPKKDTTPPRASHLCGLLSSFERRPRSCPFRLLLRGRMIEPSRVSY